MSRINGDEYRQCIEAEHAELEPAYTGRNGKLDVMATVDNILRFHEIIGAQDGLAERVYTISTLHLLDQSEQRSRQRREAVRDSLGHIGVRAAKDIAFGAGAYLTAFFGWSVDSKSL